MSDKVLGGALDLSSQEKNVELVYFNNLVVCKLILGIEEDSSDQDLKVLNVNVFPPLQQIIHHIMSTIIFPKGGSRNEVTKIHKIIFYCLFNCEPMNILYLMCTLIDKAHFQAKRSLSYTAPLTVVFWFVGMDLTSHRQVVIPPSHVYNKFNI